MIPGDLLSACPHRQFHTLYPAFQTVGLHCQTPTLTHACLCREAVCTIFMMVFGMTWPRGELTTYPARGGHATDLANLTRPGQIGATCLSVRFHEPGQLDVFPCARFSTHVYENFSQVQFRNDITLLYFGFPWRLYPSGSRKIAHCTRSWKHTI